MRIVDLLCVPVLAGYFTDDQTAIRAGARQDGFCYLGRPVTAGFDRIREPGRAVSVLLVLDDGFAATGDCASVQYASVAGRDEPLATDALNDLINTHIAPVLVGTAPDRFRDAAEHIDGLLVDGRPLHTAVRYGVTQALLAAVAHRRGVTMAEVVRDEYGTNVEIAPVAMFAQSGDDRYLSVDRMILKEAGVLPHGLINNVAEKMGANGEIFREYVRWVRARVTRMRARPDYRPVLHFDTYGTVGLAFGNDLTRVAGYLTDLGRIAAPFQLRIEQPVDAGNQDDQIEMLATLRSMLRERGCTVQLVADEWCNTLADIRRFVAAGAADVIHVKAPDLGGVNNTVEALLHVREAGLVAYCGGTCNETDESAKVCANVAMACGADQVLARPGMGVDEAMMIVGNEMARVASLVRSRTRLAAFPSPATSRTGSRAAMVTSAGGPLGPTRLHVIVSSTQSDSHTWNLVFLQLLIEELGHRVVNLGCCVPDDLLVTECLRRQPDVVVLSTVNGHGWIDGKRVVRRLREQPELAGLRMVIGGKLGIAQHGDRRTTDTLLAAGFDAVFEDGVEIDSFRSYLHSLAAVTS
ncbi:methylaspartate ammonia-lyase [Sphaerisporangium dianthi]|uniref:methylaspartate ammonia-lyase n=1 Tax=Sphaerisporangium dianthi TaxID=1436120 RepID=A0ABV9CVV5_9ACTN